MSEVSKSPTVHLEPNTLRKLEELRQTVFKEGDKVLNYDKIICKLINKYRVQLRKEIA